ncbi:MAG: methylated-DNA--[protein]-cysteine S-methyltransferase [Clostridia bacterium]|nr:methylated-DNA--[protein]-cysteine S-methyltransferase [Clostridia bacterium]
MDYISHYNSPIGKITLSSDGENLTGLWFDGQKYYASTLGLIREETNLAVFGKTKLWLDNYFAGVKPTFSLPLNPKGTAFRKDVWNVLQGIPWGEVTTYGEIGKIIAKKKGIATMSAQAIGGAVGHNPISVIIPCHRVISVNGGLTGYAGGIEKKEWLLKNEGYIFPDLS